MMLVVPDVVKVLLSKKTVGVAGIVYTHWEKLNICHLQSYKVSSESVERRRRAYWKLKNRNPPPGNIVVGGWQI